MSEKEKTNEIYQFLYEKAFKPMLDYATENNDEKIKKVVRETMYKFKKIEKAVDMVRYFSNIITHKTQNSEDFCKLLEQKGIQTKLEDVTEEFFKTFNDEWLNK